MIPADDDVTAACQSLARYLGLLEDVLPDEPGEGMEAGTIGRHATESSEPGNRQAWAALMNAHWGIRRREQDLHWAVHGTWRPPRGGSAGNTAAALDAIGKLSAGVDDDTADATLWDLLGWIRKASAASGIGEPRWRALPRTPDARAHRPPPQCPYCHTSAGLRQDTEHPSVIECHLPSCHDKEGRRPRAVMSRAGRGPQLEFADGTVLVVPDLSIPA